MSALSVLLVNTTQTYRRIVRVDLKFPEKPVVSAGAKDFVRKVRECVVGPPAAVDVDDDLCRFLHAPLASVDWSSCVSLAAALRCHIVMQSRTVHGCSTADIPSAERQATSARKLQPLPSFQHSSHVCVRMGCCLGRPAMLLLLYAAVGEGCVITHEAVRGRRPSLDPSKC